MKIAILGWGSLIWDPRGLPRESVWERSGPSLPLEFSRVSRDCRLTLVIDRVHGEDCETCYAISQRADLEDVIEDLQKRERTVKAKIGFVDLQRDQRWGHDQQAVENIQAWAQGHRFEGVVWTDLESNFEEQTRTAFSVDAAIDYLDNLPLSAHRCALKYFNNAPEQISTPLRRALAKK